MSIIETMYGRKSTRKYSLQPLTKEILKEIQYIADHATRIQEEIPMKIHVVEKGAEMEPVMKGIIGNYGKIIAPHFLVITSEEMEGFRENVGFTVEEVVLKLTEMGIATCWIGGQIKEDLLKNVINLPSRQKPVVLVSFGSPAEGQSLLRSNPEKINRKSLSEIVEGNLDEKWEKIMETARIAPSAVNSQPWKFKKEGKSLHAYKFLGGNFILKKILEKTNYIDVGIALCHIYHSAKVMGINLKFEKTKGPELKNSIYLISLTEV